MAVRPRSGLMAEISHEWLSALRWVAVAGSAAGAVLYSNWILENYFTRSLLPDPDMYISELSAADQPYGEWFRAGDRACAVVLVVAAVAALLGVRGSRWSTAGWAALGVFALATGLDSTVWTLVCAPNSNAACAAREATGTVPLSHQLHWLSSGMALAAAIASLLAFAIADFREDAPAPICHAGLFTLVTLVGTAIWTGVAVLIDHTDVVGMVGVAQRAELVTFAGWLIYAAVRTARVRSAAGS